MVTQKKYRGDTVEKKFTFKDENGAKVDPGTISIAIKDSTGATITTKTKTDLVYVELGVYKLLYNLPSNAEYGTWTLEVTATYSSLQNREDFHFVVRET